MQGTDATTTRALETKISVDKFSSKAVENLLLDAEHNTEPVSDILDIEALLQAISR